MPSLKQFIQGFIAGFQRDNVASGAATLAFYLMLAIFPAMIFLMTLVPYIPIAHLDNAVMGFISQMLPEETARLFAGLVREVTVETHHGLMSFGLLFALWSTSSGFTATIQELNITQGVREERSYIKVRATAFGLTLLVTSLVLSAFALIVFGGQIEAWTIAKLGDSEGLVSLFALLRWTVILAMLLLCFGLVYYLGPNLKQKFRFLSPGGLFGVGTLIVSSLAFKSYVTNFAHYSKTYGSIGAVIVLMLWLYLLGLSLLLGSELNACLHIYKKSFEGSTPRTPYLRGLARPEHV